MLSINNCVKCPGCASINASIEVVYATLISVNFQRYKNRTPLKRNSSLKASKNIIIFQNISVTPSAPQDVAIEMMTVIIRKQTPRNMLFPRFFFVIPSCEIAFFIVHLSKYRMTNKGRIVNNMSFPMKYPIDGTRFDKKVTNGYNTTIRRQHNEITAIFRKLSLFQMIEYNRGIMRAISIGAIGKIFKIIILPLQIVLNKS